jgi:hypothetical protein
MTAPEQLPVHHTREMELHEEATSLIDFDIASIRQMVAAHRDSAPVLWIVEPEGYEKDGHVLRDNEAVRLIAYVTASGMIYATDGCNSCWYSPDIQIAKATDAELTSYSNRTQLPATMLELMRRLLSEGQCSES